MNTYPKSLLKSFRLFVVALCFASVVSCGGSSSSSTSSSASSSASSSSSTSSSTSSSSSNGLSSSSSSSSSGMPLPEPETLLYQDCEYSGYSVSLTPGEYRLSQLQLAGLVNNDASSIQVPEGFEVVLYQLDDFLGYSTVISSDANCLLDISAGRSDGANWNDDVSSLIIREYTGTSSSSSSASSSASSSGSAEPPIDIVDTPFGGTIFNDPDAITSDDPTAFTNLVDSGQGERNMYDRRTSSFQVYNAWLFMAYYDDGLQIEVQVNPEFQTQDEARVEALKYAEVAGRLPTVLRNGVYTMWIHKGVNPFGGGNNNLLIHTGQAENYIRSGILEETLVHEAAHSSLDADHARSDGWIAAQEADGYFISSYAKDNPFREDIAESFLPWLVARYKADRISTVNYNIYTYTIPNRFAYFDSLNLDMYPMGSTQGDGAELTDGEIAQKITDVPESLPDVRGRSSLNNYYDVQKYLYLPDYQVHILGTENVHDWMLVGAYKMAKGMLGTLLNEEDLLPFIDHHIFVITKDDPDVPGGITGHKNTGYIGFTIILQEIICAEAVDTIRPNLPPQWRAWDTPVHEFGHAIEHSLSLELQSDEVFAESLSNYDNAFAREYFAWVTEEWFDASLTQEDEGFRESLTTFKRDYFGSIFDESKVWRGSCAGRP